MTARWPSVRVLDVCSLRPPKNEVKSRLGNDAIVSFLPMEDLGIQQKSVKPTKLRPLREVYQGYTYFADGDLLIAKITPCFQNGKCGIVRDLANGVGFGSTEYFVLRCGNRVLPEYVFYYFCRHSFLESGMAKMGGAVGQQRVPPDHVTEQTIPLPPLPEQRRIVAVLDEAFAAIAKAADRTHRSEEMSSQLASSSFIDLTNRVTQNWVKRRLGDVCTNLDSKRVPITKSDRRPGLVPYYGASGIVDHVDDWLFDEDLLLISEDGANLLSRVYPIAFSISGRAWVNNHAHVLKFQSDYYRQFIERYINSISVAHLVGGMAQPKLNQRSLNSIPVPWTESEEQLAAIVQDMSSIEFAASTLGACFAQRGSLLTGLKQSLLHHAFTGQLTAKGADRLLAEAM